MLLSGLLLLSFPALLGSSTTSQEELSTTSQEELSTTSQEELSTTSQEVLSTTSQEELSTTSQEELSTTSQEELSTTSQEELSTTSQEVLSTTSQEELSTTSQEELSTTSQEELSTTSSKEELNVFPFAEDLFCDAGLSRTRKNRAERREIRQRWSRTGGLMPATLLKNEQEKDAEVQRWLQREDPEKIERIDGLVCRIWQPRNSPGIVYQQIVLPKRYWNQVINLAHNLPLQVISGERRQLNRYLNDSTGLHF